VEDTRPTEDLVRHAQLLRARRLDQAGGSELLTTAEVQECGQQLGTKNPRDFIIAPAEVVAWQRREAKKCVREMNVFAAVFHHPHASGGRLLNAWVLP